MSGKYLVNSRLFQSKENTFGFHPKKNHDIFYLDDRIFPAGVDQSKVGKVFPCLVLKVVHGRIGHHLGIVAMLSIYRDYALSDKNDETH